MDSEDTILEDIDIKEAAQNLKVFDRISPDEKIPEGYTSATVVFDLRPASSLVWEKEIQSAQNLIDNGYKVCFELDLGLFSSNFTKEYPTLILALNEFRDRCLTRFYEHVAAIIFYRSKKAFSSIEERDIQMDFLDLLRQELPDDIVCLLLFDVKDMQNTYDFCRMFALDRFSLYTLAFASNPLYLSCCCWNKGKGLLGYIGRNIAQHTHHECSKGLIMPRFTEDAKKHKALLDTLVAKGNDFKIISEDDLALEWEGLDELYVHKEGLAPTTLRTIEGFEATGGKVFVD